MTRKNEVTIISLFGWCKTEHNLSGKQLAELRKEAHDNAVKCLPWSQYDKTMRHLVYYYELPDNSIRVEMRPRLVDDKTFYDFVDRCKPVYCGAIHRHE